MTSGNRTIRRGLVLGCGGTLGAAWTLASLLEVERALSWDVRTADVIVGTSAGAELATLLASGISVATLVDAAAHADSADPALVRHFASPPPSFPPSPGNPLSWKLGSARLGATLFRGTGSRLAAITALLPIGRGDPSFLDALVDAHVEPGAWVPHPKTFIVAVDFDTGRRVPFGPHGAPRASMRDAVRASWAIPGWFPPVVIDGHRYVDGGVASPTSADLLEDERLDEVVVIAPMSSTDQGARSGLGRVEGLVRRAMQRTLDAEVRALSARGIRVLRIEPGPLDLQVMGPNFMDRTRRLRVLESSLRTARRTVGAALSHESFKLPPGARAGAAA